MKILYVAHDNMGGGASISLLEMITEISKQNEVLVITPHKTGFLSEKLDMLGIKHINAHYYWWFIKKGNNKYIYILKRIIYYFAVKINEIEAKRIARKLRGEKFDIVHTNSSVINFGALLAQNLNIPHLWHIRELEESFNFVPVINRTKLYSFISNNSDCIIAISKFVKERIEERTHSDRVKLIYNGVKADINIEKGNFPKQGDVINFLISGNICREKGQETVILATKELLQMSVTRFHVYIAGGGSKILLEKMVERYHLKPFVTILGRVSDMRTLRKSVNVEIMGSKMEPFGRVTVEAMRASNPVIGTDSGGTKELIMQGVNGFLYNYEDYQSLAMHMKAFIEQPELIEKMGRQAYLGAKDKFTDKLNAKYIMELYKNIEVRDER